MTMKNKTQTTGILLAILAAALYALNSPLSKILLDYMPSTLMAGFLYIGAGVGMGVIALVRRAAKINQGEERLTKNDLPYTTLFRSGTLIYHRGKRVASQQF